MKQQLIKIMEENLETDPAEPVPKSIKYDIRRVREAHVANERKASVTVVDKDTCDVAYQLHDQGLNPLVLNFASDKRPGGGCYNGARAQEECLFYRSLYHLALPENMYPLKPCDAIYSPSVPFIRDAELRKTERVRKLACLAIAAVRHPELDSKGQYASSQDKELMRLKIEAVFHIGAEHKHDALVLGAFGCGVFRNPPEQVAQLFKEAIVQYGHSFSQIVFAVLDTSDDKSLLKVFQKVLE